LLICSVINYEIQFVKIKKPAYPVKGKPVEYFKKYNMASPLTEESVAPPKPY
jgi:hypothetical protein